MVVRRMFSTMLALVVCLTWCPPVMACPGKGKTEMKKCSYSVPVAAIDQVQAYILTDREPQGNYVSADPLQMEYIPSIGIMETRRVIRFTRAERWFRSKCSGTHPPFHEIMKRPDPATVFRSLPLLC